MSEGFEWSLKPFLLLMRIVGVPLDVPHKNHNRSWAKRYRCWWIILSILIFFIDNEFQLSMLLHRIMNTNFLMKESTKLSSVFIWNEYIDAVNTFVCYFGSHLFIMMFLVTKWCHVAEVFHCMEQQSFYSQQDYKRFRTVVNGGIAAAFTV